MGNSVIRGNLCYSHDRDTVIIRPNTYLVCEDGVCAGIFDTLPERYAALPLTDFGDRLVLPGLIDLHVHAPLFAFR